MYRPSCAVTGPFAPRGTPAAWAYSSGAGLLALAVAANESGLPVPRNFENGDPASHPVWAQLLGCARRHACRVAPPRTFADALDWARTVAAGYVDYLVFTGQFIDCAPRAHHSRHSAR